MRLSRPSSDLILNLVDFNHSREFRCALGSGPLVFPPEDVLTTLGRSNEGVRRGSAQQSVRN